MNHCFGLTEWQQRLAGVPCPGALAGRGSRCGAVSRACSHTPLTLVGLPLPALLMPRPRRVRPHGLPVARQACRPSTPQQLPSCYFCFAGRSEAGSQAPPPPSCFRHQGQVSAAPELRVTASTYTGLSSLLTGYHDYFTFVYFLGCPWRSCVYRHVYENAVIRKTLTYQFVK